MTEKVPNTDPDWLDPADDAPELTDEMVEVAEYAVGDTVIRPATGYLDQTGVVRGRPPERGVAKRQVTLRLDPDVVDKFREGGPGWQGRMNAALRKVAGL